MDDKKLLFIYNPRAGKGQIRNNLLDIIDTFVKAGYVVTARPTQYAGEAVELAADRTAKYDLVVCSGGDGTLDEVVTGIMKSVRRRPIGYIPAGSTNDFAQSLNIPNEPLLFDLFYGGKGAGEESEEDLLNRMKTSIPPVTEETPAFRNIHISNIVCRGSGRAMFFNGLPEMPISNITVKNVVMTEATDGVVISQVDGVTLENVYVESSKGNNILNVKNAKNLTVDGKVYEELGAKEEILSLK